MNYNRKLPVGDVKKDENHELFGTLIYEVKKNPIIGIIGAILALGGSIYFFSNMSNRDFVRSDDSMKVLLLSIGLLIIAVLLVLFMVLGKVKFYEYGFEYENGLKQIKKSLPYDDLTSIECNRFLTRRGRDTMINFVTADKKTTATFQASEYSGLNGIALILKGLFKI